MARKSRRYLNQAQFEERLGLAPKSLSKYKLTPPDATRACQRRRNGAARNHPGLATRDDRRVERGAAGPGNTHRPSVLKRRKPPGVSQGAVFYGTAVISGSDTPHCSMIWHR